MKLFEPTITVRLKGVAALSGPLQGYEGVAGGQFTTPDQEYPSYLELRLTATDSRGITDTESVRLDPQTVQLSFQSNPSGLQLEGVLVAVGRSVVHYQIPRQRRGRDRPVLLVGR
jgi:hypothetical protein